jgi:hypothetical protein
MTRLPKRPAKPLNPKSPLNETEQRGLQVRVNRRVEAHEELQESFKGGSVTSPKKILKKAARRDITAAADHRGTQRMLEARRKET